MFQVLVHRARAGAEDLADVAVGLACTTQYSTSASRAVSLKASPSASMVDSSDDSLITSSHSSSPPLSPPLAALASCKANTRRLPWRARVSDCGVPPVAWTTACACSQSSTDSPSC